MQDDETARELAALRERADHLRKKIGYVSPIIASRLARPLVSVNREIARIEGRAGCGSAGAEPAGHNSEIQSQVRDEGRKLGALERRANALLVGLAIVCLACAGFSLYMVLLFFQGRVRAPLQTSPMGNDKAYVIAHYPSGLVPGEWARIQCEICKKMEGFQGKLVVQLEDEGRFFFEKDEDYHTFDFSAPPLLSSLKWSVQIQYPPKDSWGRRLCRLACREHVDVIVREGKTILAQECMSFLIVSIYTEIGRLAAALVTALMAILAAYCGFGKGLTEAARALFAPRADRRDKPE